MTLPRPRRKRPRFNGSPSDHAPTEQWLSQLRTEPEDGTTAVFTGASNVGLPDVLRDEANPGFGWSALMMVARAQDEAVSAAPLDGYRPQPAAFPALPAAPEPEPERPVLAEVNPLTETAVIGNQLRLPVIWCEMPRCINWDHDPDSLGERDTRERAIARGWRTDALGRLACPECQQTRSDYRTPRPVTCHHPEVPRRWYWHDPEVQRRWASGEHISGHIGLGEEETFRLGIEAELGHRVTREDFALACAIGDATFRHHRAVTS